MNFGKLDRKITLRTFTSTQNDRGEDIESYADLAGVWAQKIEKQGKESNSAGVEQGQRITVWKIRYRTDLTAKMQIIYDNETYDIIEPPRELGRRAGLEFTTVRRQG